MVIGFLNSSLYYGNQMINFANYNFHHVIELPSKYEIYDFTKGYDENRTLATPYGVGKYNEKRINMYKGPLYMDQRDIHVGIDIGAPVGTPIHSFYDGEIFMTAYNSLPYDYGYTIITKHSLDGEDLYVLHGHLNKKSIEGKKPTQKILKGEVLGWLGDKSENGGWNSHVHIQLSLVKPTKCDMPGVVSEKDLKEALLKYPDPRLILGPLY
jgi:murein DD-endopeptidase MepM/ murein hydrolase activator NlpD